MASILVGSMLWRTNVYALTPGEATPVAPLVTIHGLATRAHPDTIMLTDVYLQQLSAWQWLTMHFAAHVEFVNANQLTEPGIPTSQLAAQGYLQMSDSKQAAMVAALRALGWTIPATSTGAVIDGVVSSSPASRTPLRVADEVVAVNGQAVRSTCALVAAVHSRSPGVTLHLLVRRARISARGDISYGAPRSVAITTAAPPSDEPTSGCRGVSGPERSWLGLSLEDGVHYGLPGSITIKTNYIGGPSAGLAMTLTLIDELSAGSLTGHRRIAATGTISPSGAVGDVGGVAEKTVAVQRAGAQIFFVPDVEVATARAAAAPGLRVLGVSTLAQALQDLGALGGTPPTSLSKPY